jgi:hypothetical protein
MIHSEVTEGLKACDRVLIGEAAAGQRVRVHLQAMPAGAGD